MLKSHQSRGFFICALVTILVLVLYVTRGFENLENRAIDYRFKVRGNRPTDKDITLVDIDDKSIEELGRWPWPRATHGKLIERLNRDGAKAIAFDVLFTEPDKKDPASDLELAQAAKAAGNVVMGFFFQGDIGGDMVGKDPIFPYRPLVDHCYTGFVNLRPDDDGVSRHANLYALTETTLYPSLAVATFALSQGKTVKEVLPQLPIGDPNDPANGTNRLFVNYAFSTQQDVYPRYSYADVLGGRVPAGTFKDKVVFVGGSAAALFDIKAIPFTSIFPGVMIHANVIDNLRHGTWIRELPRELTFIYVLLLGLILGIFLPRLNTWGRLLLFVALVGGGILLGLWLFSRQNLVIGMVPPLFAGLGCYGGLLFYQVVVEEREKRRIKGSFKQYLSPKIIDIITKDPSKLKLGGEEREVSIFFLDIAGFTTMSEALKPAQLVEVMNECLTAFSEIILKHDGLINKYIGDCIMAFWNAPADQPKHAGQACLAALDCIAALPELNRRFQAKGLPSIDCRVGINTGTVVVGNMGSHEKFDYTVMGDPVNLASRLEGANKQYHSHIMISDETFDKAREEIEARDLDLIRVKGKKEPRRVFEVLCKKGEMTEEIEKGRQKYHEALKLYRDKNFEEAIATFEEVFHYLPNDYLSRIYLERARVFASHPPPPAWDGVFEMTSK